MKINKGELDRHITGNYGEDKLDEDEMIMLSESVSQYIAQLEANNEKLREALYCNCRMADATALPNTHEFSCRYRVVMRRIEAGGE